MPRRKRTAKPRSVKSRSAKPKSNKVLFVAIAVLIVAVIIAVVISMPVEQPKSVETPTQQENQSTSTVISSGDFCTRDSQCFSASCKSTPSVWKCVNVTSQELYYKNCKAYYDVNVVQDPSRCKCVQGMCTAVT